MIPELTYRPAQPGDEHQISDCIRAAAPPPELTGEAPASNAEWEQMSGPEEVRARISSSEKTVVATCQGMVVGFIAFRRGNHLSLLFVRNEYAGQGIGRELFTQCLDDLDEITVNSSDMAIGFYKKVGFALNGERFFHHGGWSTPMKWVKGATI